MTLAETITSCAAIILAAVGFWGFVAVLWTRAARAPRTPDHLADHPILDGPLGPIITNGNPR